PIDIYNNTSEPNRLSAVEDVTLFHFPSLSYNVDKGIVVRAVVKDQDGNCSDVVSNSYFVGKTAGYYQDMKVISIATESDNLFDPDKGIYVVGTAYYDWWNNGGKYQNLEAADSSNPTNYNQHGKEWEIPASMQVIENGSAVYAANIGIRINGNWSRGYKQKSLRLCARSEYGDSKLRCEMIPGLTDANGNPIDVFDKLVLHNGGNDLGILYMRDALLQSLCSDLAFGTNSYEPCIVFIDGEFWGMYTIRECIDEDAIASHYHVDKDNVTFIKNWETTGLESVGAEFDTLCRWGIENDMSVQENYQKICDAIDMESFMDLIAVETYLNDADFAPTYLNNYQLWRVNTPEDGNPYGDGKWRFFLNDIDMCANIYGSTETSPSYDLLGNMYTDAEYMNFTGLFYSLLDNAEFRETFRLRYLHIIENTFYAEQVSTAAEAYSNRCRTAIEDTNSRFSMSWYNYSYEFSTFLRFFRERPDYARKYLDNLLNKYDRTQNPEQIASS
ncbi:MAG: CotH kinase family protein, partial [Oscillospiraceae bacterium]|nr:CotH kinase family protein [Oscillospiraceae bacterium]